MRCILLALSIVLGLAVVAPLARADDRIRAAEHFSRAESAEKNGDFRTAVDEYQRAYELSPHPAVLYNLGRVSERMGAYREAARHFLRYLDESDDASDRDEVTARVAALRARPSTVTITANPAAATISVDGKRRGTAPLELELEGGEHTITASHGATESPPRRVAFSFGEPATIHIDLRARPGVLQVYADVDGAQVSIDGAVAGPTPLVTEIAAGPHEVVVRAPGYQIVRRRVDVPSDGSEQVRASLAPLPGSEVGEVGVGESQPARGTKVLYGLGYGWQSDAVRYQFEVGMRTAADHLDLSAFAGTFGTELGLGVGLQSRFFFATGALRPYLRAAGLLGAGNATDEGKRFAAEGAIGVLLVPRGNAGTPSLGSLDYYLEVGAQYRSSGGDDDSAVGFPLAAGILWRLGG